jgi:hypothetical protein
MATYNPSQADLDRIIASPHKRADSYEFDKMISHLGTFTMGKYKPKKPDGCALIRQSIVWPHADPLPESEPTTREKLGPYHTKGKVLNANAGPAGGITRMPGAGSSFEHLPPAASNKCEPTSVKHDRGTLRLIPAPSLQKPRPVAAPGGGAEEGAGINPRTLAAKFAAQEGRCFLNIADVKKAEACARRGVDPFAAEAAAKAAAAAGVAQSARVQAASQDLNRATQALAARSGVPPLPIDGGGSGSGTAGGGGSSVGGTARAAEADARKRRHAARQRRARQRHQAGASGGAVGTADVQPPNFLASRQVEKDAMLRSITGPPRTPRTARGGMAGSSSSVVAATPRSAAGQAALRKKMAMATNRSSTNRASERSQQQPPPPQQQQQQQQQRPPSLRGSARDRRAAGEGDFAGLTQFEVGTMAVGIPTHQMIIFQDPNYKPDPETGFSRWPIPGMQGARHPFRDAPMAIEGGGVRMGTTSHDDQQNVCGRTWKDGRRMESEAKWAGEFGEEDLVRPKRSEDESAHMKTMMPLPFGYPGTQADGNVGTRGFKGLLQADGTFKMYTAGD